MISMTVQGIYDMISLAASNGKIRILPCGNCVSSGSCNLAPSLKPESILHNRRPSGPPPATVSGLPVLRLRISALPLVCAVLLSGCALGPESSLLDALEAGQTSAASQPPAPAATAPQKAGNDVDATIAHLRGLSESRGRKRDTNMQSSVEELLLLRQRQAGDLSEQPVSEASSQN